MLAKTTFEDSRLGGYRLEDDVSIARPIHSLAPIHALEKLRRGFAPRFSVQRVMPESFRREVAERSAFKEWQAVSLTDVDLSTVKVLRSTNEAPQKRAPSVPR
jgi:hypothetical protein